MIKIINGFSEKELAELVWSRPNFAQVELTRNCNFRCKFCFENCDLKNKFEDKPPEMWKKVIDGLYDLGIKKIHFSGGENFLYTHFKEILKYSKEKGLNNLINTNGSIDISDILDSAISGQVDNNTLYQKILSLFGTELKEGIKTLISILVIIIIHSILKSISENLENDTISTIIYYVQYIAIVTIIMSNFSDIVQMVRDTANNLVGFMNCLVPILLSLMIYTGSITTGSVIEPIILFMINFIGNMIETIFIPFTLIIAVMCIISKISDKVQVEKLSKFTKYKL